MAFALSPFDDSFFESAPAVFREVFEIPLPAAEVWSELTGDNPFGWCTLVKRVAWTSPRPSGPGTTRTAWTLGGAFVIEERFFRWDEGRRSSSGAAFSVLAPMRSARSRQEQGDAQRLGQAHTRASNGRD